MLSLRIVFRNSRKSSVTVRDQDMTSNTVLVCTALHGAIPADTCVVGWEADGIDGDHFHV